MRRLATKAGVLAVGLFALHADAVPVTEGTPSPATATSPAQPLRQRAKEALDAGRFAEATTLWEEYIADRPDDPDAHVHLGWSRYRLGRAKDAQASFAKALALHAASADAKVGLGYAMLQIEGPEAAARLFREVLAQDPAHHDALEGMVVAGRRADASRRVVKESQDASRKLQALTGTLRPDLLPQGTERRPRGPLDPSRPLAVPARALKDFIEIDDGGTWRPLFVKGFNLGAALPGRFAAEFATDAALYSEWLAAMSGMGANAVRLYTLLPPEFYRALLAHNQAHPDRRLWLVQGVWTELPDKHDFSDKAYVAEFHAETARVIDAVHGNLVLGPRPGHASGVYEADVSASVLAYIIGREWEPFAVTAYNRLKAGEADFRGRWFEVVSGRPMEAWVASVCDFAAEHEATQYRVVHPLTFANWPTLDPLSHPTESTRMEEDYWRDKNGVAYEKILRELPWEDDGVTLDPTLIHPTPAMGAGFFAAYHIYPNYPDFMNNDPEYDTARDAQGPSRYAGYLAALKEYHGTQPVLVAEFGMSTSRGPAHLHPQGWSHGGVSEAEQGALVSRMLRNIHAARYAGGIVFEFMDEWFKSTWSVALFEAPLPRRKNWFNAESPEESYGVTALRPAGAAIVVDGRAADWAAVPVLASAGR